MPCPSAKAHTVKAPLEDTTLDTLTRGSDASRFQASGSGKGAD